VIGSPIPHKNFVILTKIFSVLHFVSFAASHDKKFVYHDASGAALELTPINRSLINHLIEFCKIDNLHLK